MKMSFSIPVSRIFVLLVASVFLLAGCKKEEEPVTALDVLTRRLEQVDQVQLNSDLAVIDDSLDLWGLADKVQKEPNGVRYIVDTLGTGPFPVLESAVRMKYTGKLLSTGEVFDSNNNAVFFLFELITGFQTTVPLLPVGTKATLYIPSGYGYGPNDNVDPDGNVIIPGNANLIFEIEILEIV